MRRKEKILWFCIINILEEETRQRLSKLIARMTTTKDEREYNGTSWNYRGITYVTYEQGLGVNAPKHIVYRRNPLCDFVPCSTAGWVVYVREIRASTFMLTTWSGAATTSRREEGCWTRWNRVGSPKLDLGFDLIRKRGQFLDGTKREVSVRTKGTIRILVSRWKKDSNFLSLR